MSFQVAENERNAIKIAMPRTTQLARKHCTGRFATRHWLTLVFIAALVNRNARAQAPAVVSVPFVGCESRDQAQTYAGPEGPDKKVQIAAESAHKLAYYKAEVSSGILAPRGWHCYGVLGSSGSDFLVMPQPFSKSGSFQPALEMVRGPAIQVHEGCTDNSGRLDIARVLARAFPKQRSVVEEILRICDLPMGDVPFGPYPKDEMIRRSDWLVEFRTPPETQGLGTAYRLPAGTLEIRGAAILRDREPQCLLFVAVRLPTEQADLAPQILREIELENGWGLKR
jgi:hypothetical protein